VLSDCSRDLPRCQINTGRRVCRVGGGVFRCVGRGEKDRIIVIGSRRPNLVNGYPAAGFLLPLFPLAGLADVRKEK